MSCQEAELAAQVREVSEIAYQLEKSAAGMVRACASATADGDQAGAAREQAIAAREYEWAARLWAAMGQVAHERHDRALADRVGSGDLLVDEKLGPNGDQ